MQTNTAVMRSLVFVAIVACTIWTVTDAEKVSPCCVAVSRSMVKETITGYRLQQKKPPCVKAIIFQTEKGQFCIDHTQAWAKKKIIELRNSQRNSASATTVSPHVTVSVPLNSTASS